MVELHRGFLRSEVRTPPMVPRDVGPGPLRMRGANAISKTGDSNGLDLRRVPIALLGTRAIGSRRWLFFSVEGVRSVR